MISQTDLFKIFGIAFLFAVASLHYSALNAWAIEHAIYVKIMVDEEEASTPEAWKQRLTDRLQNASEALYPYSGIRFVPLAYATWDSDDRIRDLSKTLREFEQEVNPKPADIAIGFSSQYQFQSGRNSMGGTRGPMRTHILLRENARSVYEPDRLEVLAHEMGHYLGAAHSPSASSVMRPVLADGRARAKAYRISLDDQNAEIVRLVSTEIRKRNIKHYQQLSPLTLQKLKVLYGQLNRRLPADPAAPIFISFVDRLLQAQAQFRTGTQTIETLRPIPVYDPNHIP